MNENVTEKKVLVRCPYCGRKSGAWRYTKQHFRCVICNRLFAPGRIVGDFNIRLQVGLVNNKHLKIVLLDDDGFGELLEQRDVIPFHNL